MRPAAALLLAALQLLLLAPQTPAGLYSRRDDVVVLDEATFRRRVLEGPELWVIEWYADWCGGCRMASPWCE